MSDDQKKAEAEWLRRAADLEEEAGGFPSETGVILNAVRGQDPAASLRCPRCGYPSGETKRIVAWANSYKDPGRAMLGLRPVTCELCGEMHLEDIL